MLDSPVVEELNETGYGRFPGTPHDLDATQQGRPAQHSGERAQQVCEYMVLYSHSYRLELKDVCELCGWLHTSNMSVFIYEREVLE